MNGERLMLKRIISAAVSAVMLCAAVPVMTSAAEEADGLILHYSFDDVNAGNVVSDESGNGNDGTVSGSAMREFGRMYFDGKDDYITMPQGLLKDTEAVTVAVNMCPEFDTIHYFAWNFGNSSSDGYMFLNTSRPEAKLRFAITPGGGSGEEALASDNDVKKGTWSSIIVTIDGKHGKMYRDGEQVAETDFKTAPKDLGDTKQNWIARSPYGDALLKGYVEDFRVYDRALSEQEVKALSEEYKSNLSDPIINALSAVKSVVKEDMALPTEADGAVIKWTSDDPAHITAAGKVTRPGIEEPAVQVNLTAEIAKDGKTDTKTFEVTVPPEGGGTYCLKVTNEKRAEISDTMVGLFFEDINYAADGGLYAEMIENRSFEANYCDNKDFEPRYDGGWAWSAYPADKSGAVMEYKTDKPLNANNTHYLSFTPSAEQKGFANAAYDGLALKKGMKYNGSLFARSGSYQGSIKVRAEKDGKTVASAEISGITDEWKKYEFTFSASENVRGAKLVTELDGDAAVDFDMISLIPDDAVDGIFRRDLAEKLKDIKPGFLRFPGGCIVEGYNLDNRYKWKDGIGAPEERKENWNRWDLHTTGYNHYNQTMGMSFFEFFKLCEYLECEAVPVVNVGMACQFQTNETVALDSAEFEQYVRDALDLIEFANGGTDTEWGAKRAAMGHPEPFNITMLGIGNEQWNTEKNQFFKRYEAFEKAIHEKYPDMKLIGTSGPDVTSGNYRNAWEWIRGNKVENDSFVYAVDEHYYMTPDWFLQNTDFYDDYDRGVNVFAGEYASRERNKPNDPEANTLYTALTEAAYFTGLERNADIVKMSCYAPLFARVGYTQWSPDLIWFDDAASYGTPSYLVQKLNGNNLGDYTVGSEVTGGVNKEGVFTSASYDNDSGQLIIKAVNVNEENRSLQLDLSAWDGFSGSGSVSYITGADPDASNSIDKPDNISIREETLANTGKSFSYVLAPYTYAVLRIPCGIGNKHYAFINGRSSGRFEPEAAVTRAELAAMLMRVKNEEPAAEAAPFSDIPAGAWYEGVAAYAYRTGIVKGYEDGTFRPDRPVSVTEFKTVLSRLGYTCALSDSEAPVSRGMAVKQICLMRCDDSCAASGKCVFDDVDKESDVYKYVMLASEDHYLKK